MTELGFINLLSFGVFVLMVGVAFKVLFFDDDEMI